MARFTHPAIEASASTEEGTWTIVGGTIDGDQPTFSGDPLFAGNWTVLDGVCTFAITVDFDNITDFGSGQYYLEIPFPSDDDIIFSSGCLHDTSTGEQYFILGSVDAGTDVMKLFTVGSNGRQDPFTSGVPVTLNVADDFHIAGTYQIVPGSLYA